MATIGEVEAFVAKRKVGNLLLSKCHRKSHPVMERWVNNFVMGKPAIWASQSNMAYFASPPFH